MRTLFTRTVASLILISLLALAGCATGTNGIGSTGSNPGSAPTGTQDGIPAEGEPLASGTPVMYEFYSDT